MIKEVWGMLNPHKGTDEANSEAYQFTETTLDLILGFKNTGVGISGKEYSQAQYWLNMENMARIMEADYLVNILGEVFCNKNLTIQPKSDISKKLRDVSNKFLKGDLKFYRSLYLYYKKN